MQISVNTGDGIDYHQRYQENIGDLIQETLEILEKREDVRNNGGGRLDK